MFLTVDVGAQMGLISQRPKVTDVASLSVIAAGRIADACGITAALALGAAVVQLSTAYLHSDVSLTNAAHRAASQSPGARQTAITNLFSGRPARGIVNCLMSELGPMNHGVPAFPNAAALATLRAKSTAAGSNFINL